MQWPGNKADVLRAVGHILDAREAMLLRVEEDDRFLTVRAIRSGLQEEISYSSADLQALLAASLFMMQTTSAFSPFLKLTWIMRHCLLGVDFTKLYFSASRIPLSAKR